MSKKQKLFERLSRKPPPTDFRWAELVSLAEQHGFVVSCPGGGSHHIFQHPDGLTFRASKTHPGGLLKLYQIDDALDALNKART